MADTLPAMVNGKTRRPPHMRADIAAVDPRTDPGMGKLAFFEYRDDAIEAGRQWCEPQGWIVRPQYVGRYDLWILEASRKSWGYRLAPIRVEACLHPERVVVRHAHVPLTHSADRVMPPCIAGDHYPNDGGTACYYCGLPAEIVAPDELAEAWQRVAAGLED